MLKHALSPTEQWLLAEYGALIDSANVARILGFKSTNALAQARSRGQLSLQMIRVPNRRGWWATPRLISQYLESLTQDEPDRRRTEAMAVRR